MKEFWSTIQLMFAATGGWLGYFLGGLLVDEVFEPVMALQQPDSLLVTLFGSGEGSGAAFCFAVLGVLGVLVCLLFRKDRHIDALEKR